MNRTYVGFLKSVLHCDALDRRSWRALAGAVDDITIPAGAVIPRTRGELVIVASGLTQDCGKLGTLAVTRLRLLVFGRRELLSLFLQLPDVVVQALLGNEAVLAEADLQLDSPPPRKQIDSLFDRDVGASAVHQPR